MSNIHQLDIRRGDILKDHFGRPYLVIAGHATNDYFMNKHGQTLALLNINSDIAGIMSLAYIDNSDWVVIGRTTTNLILQNMIKPEPIKYGFFSANAKYQYGSVIWKHKDGYNVEITAVDNTPNGDDYKWNDKVCVGQVIKHISGAIQG